MTSRNLTTLIRNSSTLFSFVACGQAEPCSVDIIQKRFISPTVQDAQLSPAVNYVPQQACAPLSRKDKRKASLVIFDKDGTLICFHSTWVPWAKNTAQRIAELTKMDLKNDVYDVLGYSPKQQKVNPGLLASATVNQIKNALAHLLITKGFDSAEALRIVSAAIHYSDQRMQHTEKPIFDLRYLFETLQKNNVKVALCTSDSRKGTMSTLKRLQLEKLVDLVVCGDDPGAIPKPHPHNALSICRQLDVDPMDTLVVGDTLADLGMGRSANVGGTIGVLSGICNQEELRPLADYVVADVGNILPIVENMRPPCLY